MLLKKLTLKSISLFLVASSSLAAFGFALAFRWTQTSLASGSSDAPATLLDSSKEQDGLTGPVHRVRTERARLLNKSGKLAEGARELLEATTYDLQGHRIESSYYLIRGGLATGTEEYRYDEKGNIVEMTMRDPQNSIVSKEVYTYEFDAVGNWTKMNTFLVVFEAGRLSYEPAEVTYRNITYYYNQTISDLNRLAPSQTSGSSEGGDSSTNGGDDQAQTSAAMRQAPASLSGALDEWVAATNARDIDKQISFYAPTVKAFYRASNVSREFVRAEKARVFQRADVIDVRASDPEIMFDGEERTATMRFRKQYLIKGGGQDRSGEVVQEMRWQLLDGGWKITSERDVRVIR
jgi:ketosteroid isomerase-like protein